MFTSAALHGVEAPLVSQAALGWLRSANVRAVTSGGMPLAKPGAILSLLDEPERCEPGFHVVWCGLRMLWRFMAHNSGVAALDWIYGLVRAGAAGHGLFHQLVHSACSIGFGWDSSWSALSLADG